MGEEERRKTKRGDNGREKGSRATEVEIHLNFKAAKQTRQHIQHESPSETFAALLNLTLKALLI